MPWLNLHKILEIAKHAFREARVMRRTCQWWHAAWKRPICKLSCRLPGPWSRLTWEKQKLPWHKLTRYAGYGTRFSIGRSIPTHLRYYICFYSQCLSLDSLDARSSCSDPHTNNSRVPLHRWILEAINAMRVLTQGGERHELTDALQTIIVWPHSPWG